MKIHLWAPNLSGFGGGIGAFSHEMARGLGALGHEVHSIEKGNASTSNFVARCFGAIVTNHPRHIVSTHVNFGPAASAAKRLFGIPYTLVAHGIDIHPQLPDRTTAAIRNADHIITVSEWTRARVLGLAGVDANKIRVLPNTFDEATFTPGEKSRALMERYSLSPDEKVVLTVARLDSAEGYKGYDRIVEALPRIQRDCGRVRFLIVGKGGDRERIVHLARDRGVDQAVTFAGFVEQSELPDHYRLADVFAMPSTGEGFGIVFVEAMACGSPVVAGNRDGSVDALDGGRLGKLIDPLDIDAVADAVTDLLKGNGSALWFDKHALHDAVTLRFGTRAFVQRLSEALPLESTSIRAGV